MPSHFLLSRTLPRGKLGGSIVNKRTVLTLRPPQEYIPTVFEN